MGFSIFKAFSLFGIASDWAAKALADGKVTITEAAELAVRLAGVLGIPCSIDLADNPGTAEASTELVEAEESEPAPEGRESPPAKPLEKPPGPEAT